MQGDRRQAALCGRDGISRNWMSAQRACVQLEQREEPSVQPRCQPIGTRFGSYVSFSGWTDSFSHHSSRTHTPRADIQPLDIPTHRLWANFRFLEEIQTNSNVLAFVRLTCSEIRKINITAKQQRNLTFKERKILKTLASNPSITIKPSDKGGNIVILDNDQYIAICNKILSNQQWYFISSKKTEKFNREFYRLMDESYAANLLTKSEYDFIRTALPRTPTFYALPKLHKDIRKPSGRPIISGNGSLTEKLSQYIDGHLRPYVLSIPSYVKDTMHLLQIIDSIHVPPKSLLMALDVEALYSSIPPDKGLACIRYVLSRDAHLSDGKRHFLIDALDFILHHNYFMFNSDFFLQVQGVAMGTSCAPSYPNLYLGEWESWLEQSISTRPHMDNVVIWHRYIDDILLVWDGTPDNLQTFVRK